VEETQQNRGERSRIHATPVARYRAGAMSPKIVDCAEEEHAGAILDIMNEAIENSTALYDYVRRPSESMARWFAAKRAGNFPVLGAVDDAGALLGFASYGTFRAWPAYKYSVEHSVYVEKGQRGRGVGRALMRELIARAERQEYHVLVGGIDLDNRASIALHEKLGFKHAGTIHHAGFKFGRWLDLAFYELLLETPRAPVDG
jgi:phosphinothricin acetyltransferase